MPGCVLDYALGASRPARWLVAPWPWRPPSRRSGGHDPRAPVVAPCAKDMAEGFECVTLTVPLDHFHDTGPTTQVTFAIKRHTGEGPAKGVFVTATGGPGTSGIQSAVEYRDGFAESIQARLRRGLLRPARCPPVG